MELAWYREHRMIVRLLAVVIPLLAAAGLYLIPDVVAKSAAALVLVLIVVAAASTGDRLSGMIAAVSAAVGFICLAGVAVLNGLVVMTAIAERLFFVIAMAAALYVLLMWRLRSKIFYESIQYLFKKKKIV